LPATLHEVQGRSGALDSRIKPIYPGMRACGPALTASWHAPDTLVLTAAVSVTQSGDVLVIRAGDRPEQGGFGEALATVCMAKGIVGIVTDAGIRDGSALRERDFGAFYYGLCIKGTVKGTLGVVNQPVIIGDVLIGLGDIVTADDVGVIVVPGSVSPRSRASTRSARRRRRRS
jgi:4-hydroxy-4-methyl-2-oxoglutarate aldolase